MNRRQLTLYVSLDVAASLVVWLLFYLYRRLTNDYALAGGTDFVFFVPSYDLGLSALAFPLVALAVHYLSGAYISRAPHLRVTEFFTTVVATFLISIVIYFAMLTDDVVVSYRFYLESFLILWALFFLATYIPRAIQTRIMLGPIGEIRIDTPAKGAFLSTPAWQIAIKRAFDLTVSLVALVVLLPFMICVAVIIRFDSPGPVFYTQRRVGLEGREFRIFKFRSMCRNAEQHGPELTAPNDPRITHFGHFMRRYRVDELPQLLNVIIGDMSIVGPRPERRYFVEQIERIEPRYSELLRVRPGLLSWGPIRVGYSDSIDKMVLRLKYDLEYVEHLSLSTDLKIIFLSIQIVLGGRGR